MNLIGKRYRFPMGIVKRCYVSYIYNMYKYACSMYKYTEYLGFCLGTY